MIDWLIQIWVDKMERCILSNICLLLSWVLSNAINTSIYTVFAQMSEKCKGFSWVCPRSCQSSLCCSPLTSCLWSRWQGMECVRCREWLTLASPGADRQKAAGLSAPPGPCSEYKARFSWPARTLHSSPSTAATLLPTNWRRKDTKWDKNSFRSSEPCTGRCVYCSENWIKKWITKRKTYRDTREKQRGKNRRREKHWKKEEWERDTEKERKKNNTWLKSQQEGNPHMLI